MKLRNFFLVLVLMSVTGVLGFEFGQKKLQFDFANWKAPIVINNTPTGAGASADMAQFWEVWDKLAAEYVDKAALDPVKLMHGATAGMVAALGDPYTVFLTPEQNLDAKADLGGTFEGVGIQLGFVDRQLAVVSPLEGTPAKLAGVRAGDLIVHIKDQGKKIDQQTDGLTLPQAVNMIRGKGGTTVQLTLVREGVAEPFEVELVRQTIQVKSAEVEFVGDVAWLKLNKFGDKTQFEWDGAVENIKNQNANIKGVVLDVRNNPGGYLEGAVYMASEFLATGKTVVIQQAGDGSRVEAKVTREGRLLKIPVVILVNEGSASAAEILAGALQDHSRAKVVGVKSFGKGSVQQPDDLYDGAGVHITVAKWLKPDGEWIDKNGIIPDVELKLDPEIEIKSSAEDPQLQKAIELL